MYKVLQAAGLIWPHENYVGNLWIILNLDFSLKQISWMFSRTNTYTRWIQHIATRGIMGSPLGFVGAMDDYRKVDEANCWYGVDDPEHPRGTVNHRCTPPSGRTDTLPRNLIVIPRAGFTTATVWRSRSPFSSCTRSRASKLEAAQHHSRVIERKGVKRKGGRREWWDVFSPIVFWRSSEPFISVTPHRSHWSR
jgi:hypothetical protein